MQILNIFCSSKRILIFLFEEKILIPDKSAYEKIIKADYYTPYFYKEFKSFYSKDDMKYAQEKIGKDFSEYEKNRKIGENHNYICKLIRMDSVKEFISYSNKNNISPDSRIPESIYETNWHISEYTSIIEYVAFYGSTKIFNYLYQNKKIQFKDYTLYKIMHSQNQYIIDIFEKNTNEDEYKQFCRYEEAIIFHSNDIIKKYYEKIKSMSKFYYIQLLRSCVESYNFMGAKICKISDNIMNILNKKKLTEHEVYKNDEFFFSFCAHGYFNVIEIFAKLKTEFIF